MAEIILVRQMVSKVFLAFNKNGDILNNKGCLLLFSMYSYNERELYRKKHIQVCV